MCTLGFIVIAIMLLKLRGEYAMCLYPGSEPWLLHINTTIKSLQTEQYVEVHFVIIRFLQNNRIAYISEDTFANITSALRL